MSTNVVTTSKTFQTPPPGKLPIPALNHPQKPQGTPDLVKQLQQLLALPSEKRQAFLKSNPRLLYELQRLQLQKQQQQKQAPPVTAAAAQGQVVPKPGGLLQSLASIGPPKMPSRKQLFAQRMLKDQKAAIAPDTKTPFKSFEDACTRLLRYHVYQEREPTEEEKHTDEEMYDSKSQELLSKYHRMLNKYQYLLIQESMKKSPIAEVVMMERVFIQQEKDRLKEEKTLAKDHPELFKPCPAPVEKKTEPVAKPEVIDLDDSNSPDDMNTDETVPFATDNADRPQNHFQSMDIRPESDKPPSLYDVHMKGSLKLVIKSSPKHAPEFDSVTSSPSHDSKEENASKDKDSKPLHFKERFKRKSWNTHGDHDRTSDCETPPKVSKEQEIDRAAVVTSKTTELKVIKTEPTESVPPLPFTSYSQEKTSSVIKKEDELYDFEKSDMDYALEDYAQSIDNTFQSGINNSSAMSDSSRIGNGTHLDTDQFIDDFLNSQSEMNSSTDNTFNPDVAKHVSSDFLPNKLHASSIATPSATDNPLAYGNFSPVTPEEKFSVNQSSKSSAQTKRDPAEMQSAINSILDVDMGSEQFDSGVADSNIVEAFANSTQDVADEDLDAAINSIL